MTLKIYGLAFSTAFMRVITTLEEKNVDDYSIENVDLWKGEHKHPEYLKLQPFGQIPVLEDGDLILFESRAISRYICEKFDSKGHSTLLGQTPKERALVNQWLEVEAQNFNPPLAIINFQVLFTSKFGGKTNDQLVAKELAKLEKVLNIYESHLALNKYLAGNFFSLADMSHLPQMHYLINVAEKGHGITSRNHLNAWWEDISSRCSWQKVLALQKQENE